MRNGSGKPPPPVSRQYEIANFARHKTFSIQHSTFDIPSHACKHNVNYWRGGSFYGLGPSATGYVRGVRTKNWSNTQLYCEQLEKGKRAIESREELPPLKRAGETAAFGLRMNAGAMGHALFDVVESGIVKVQIGKTYSLADAGMAHSDIESRRTTGSLILIP